MSYPTICPNDCKYLKIDRPVAFYTANEPCCTYKRKFGEYLWHMGYQCKRRPTCIKNNWYEPKES